jgi:NAD(P)-dependent dehydrogenase (short-subunit alcohol dehydrogenase family)
VAFVRSKEKFINLLVNNAGIRGEHFPEAFTSSDPEEISRILFTADLQRWDEVIRINTSAVLLAAGDAQYNSWI